jgi:thioredoxin 1
MFHALTAQEIGFRSVGPWLRGRRRATDAMYRQKITGGRPETARADGKLFSNFPIGQELGSQGHGELWAARGSSYPIAMIATLGARKNCGCMTGCNHRPGSCEISTATCPRLERDPSLRRQFLPGLAAHPPSIKGIPMRAREIFLTAMALMAAPAQASEVRGFDPAYFNAIQAHNTSAIIFVHAAWCPVCKAQEATIKKLLATPRFKGVTVLTIDYDTQQAQWKKFGVTRQSTLIGFHGRRETARLAFDSDPDKVAAVLASTLR